MTSELGNEVDDELSVLAERLLDILAPALQLGVTRGEERADDVPERTHDRREGNVALVRLELARGKPTACARYRLLQLVHDRRLADAGVARDEHQGLPATPGDALERVDEGGDL